MVWKLSDYLISEGQTQSRHIIQFSNWPWGSSRIHIGPNTVCDLHQWSSTMSNEIVHRHVCWRHSHSFSDTSPGLTKLTPQNDLNSVEQWLHENKLVLNQSKTKWMLFGTRQKLEHSSDIVIQSHGQDIERVTSFCYSGVTLDEHLTWIGHVEIICNKANV